MAARKAAADATEPEEATRQVLGASGLIDHHADRGAAGPPSDPPAMHCPPPLSGPTQTLLYSQRSTVDGDSDPKRLQKLPTERRGASVQFYPQTD